MQIVRTLSAAAAATFLMTGAAFANPHIKIFDGTRAGSAHGGEIEILSWSWGETNDSSRPPSEGPGVLSAKARAGKHSEMLARWHEGQTRLPAVQFLADKSGDGEAYIITMRDVLVSSYQSSGSSGGDAPMESFSLNFAKIEYGPNTKPSDSIWMDPGAPVKTKRE